jgi:hypothetical protein
MPWIASRIPGAQPATIGARHFVHLQDAASLNSAVRICRDRLVAPRDALPDKALQLRAAARFG